MDVVECMSYRENLLIVAGLLFMVIQQIVFYLERRQWRQQLTLVIPNRRDDIHSIDRS